MAANISLDISWRERLEEEFSKDYMSKLKEFLVQEKKSKTIYPKGDEIFQAFNVTPFNNVKVVILGQDPYHGPSQAHGLCFSVKPSVAIPPSLQNIYKELKNDLNIEPVKHGFLQSWAKQGVLLLNSVLTVEKGNAASHQGKGWEEFTDSVIRMLNESSKHIVFILWGSYAQKKGSFINEDKHLVIRSVHPSPLSAHRGFFGSKPFSKANEFLVAIGEKPINWQLPVSEKYE